MALIHCPDCNKEISDKSKHCIFCGCPTKTARKKPKRYISFIILSIVCFCSLFPILPFVVDSNSFFSPLYDGKYGNIAYNELGSGEKRGTIANTNISFYQRVDGDTLAFDLFVDSDYFTIYLSNCEMSATYYNKQYYAEHNKSIEYVMTENGFALCDNQNLTETDTKIAEIMRQLCYTELNIKLNGKCTIDDVLTEYYGYCKIVIALKIICRVFFCGLTISSISFFVLFWVKRKPIQNTN